MQQFVRMGLYGTGPPVSGFTIFDDILDSVSLSKKVHIVGWEPEGR